MVPEVLRAGEPVVGRECRGHLDGGCVQVGGQHPSDVGVVAGNAGSNGRADDLIPGERIVEQVADGGAGPVGAAVSSPGERVRHLPGVVTVADVDRVRRSRYVHRGGGADRDVQVESEPTAGAFPGDGGFAVRGEVASGSPGQLVGMAVGER